MCFLAPGVERGEAKIVWTDAQRNEILKFLLVIFIAASKGRRKVCPGKGNEDPDACGSLEMDWERCDITKNLKTVSIIHWFQLHLKCSFLPQLCTIFKNTCYIFFCASLVVKHPGKLDLKKKKIPTRFFLTHLANFAFPPCCFLWSRSQPGFTACWFPYAIIFSIIHKYQVCSGDLGQFILPSLLAACPAARAAGTHGQMRIRILQSVSLLIIDNEGFNKMLGAVLIHFNHFWVSIVW